ncbi:MAG: hypothetical protein EKK34_07460 [Mycobacterium sp.]|nr:MAG: hypothetical protein EKK34_07460 [Mycobacterium sp.]
MHTAASRKGINCCQKCERPLGNWAWRLPTAIRAQ